MLNNKKLLLTLIFALVCYFGLLPAAFADGEGVTSESAEPAIETSVSEGAGETENSGSDNSAISETYQSVSDPGNENTEPASGQNTNSGVEDGMEGSNATEETNPDTALTSEENSGEGSDGAAAPTGEETGGDSGNEADAKVTDNSNADSGGESNSIIPPVVGPDFDYESQGSTGELGTEAISYIDADGNKQTKAAGAYVVYNGTNQFLGAGVTADVNGERWVAVTGDVTKDGLYIVGNVHLILCDGIKFTVSEYGVRIPENYSLTIYAQENFTGELTASGSYNPDAPTKYFGKSGIGGLGDLTINGGVITAYGGYYAPGIGAQSDETAGNITINGGADGSRTKVTAVGGAIKNGENTYLSRQYALCGAGIGGGGNKGSFSKITINGGTVNAIGGIQAAGIGTAGNDDLHPWDEDPLQITVGDICINGGIVTATGGQFGGAGIGGGDCITNGNITITGGTVKASSTQPDKNTINGAAGIGAGGSTAQGGDIVISGGHVIAISYNLGAGIGGGADGSGKGLDAGNITISGKDTKVSAISAFGAGIGGGGSDVGVNEHKGGNAGNITINGGTILSVSCLAGAGIGGGNQGAGGTITINDGYIVSLGGATSYRWSTESTAGTANGDDEEDPVSKAMDDIVSDIGYEYIADWICSLIFDKDYAGSGIGAGSGGKTANVAINGGTVIARAGSNSACAIGSIGNKNKQSDSTITIYEPSQLSRGKITSENKIYIYEVYKANKPGKVEAVIWNSYAKIEPYAATDDDDEGDKKPSKPTDASSDTAVSYSGDAATAVPIYKAETSAGAGCSVTLSGISYGNGNGTIRLMRNGVIIDPQNYTLTIAADGSIIVTFTEEYLNSLPEGLNPFSVIGEAVAVIAMLNLTITR